MERLGAFSFRWGGSSKGERLVEETCTCPGSCNILVKHACTLRLPEPGFVEQKIVWDVWDIWDF